MNCEFLKSNPESNHSVLNQICASQIESSKWFKSGFKYQSLLGFVRHCSVFCLSLKLPREVYLQPQHCYTGDTQSYQSILN